jgi:hypothetical protein
VCYLAAVLDSVHKQKQLYNALASPQLQRRPPGGHGNRNLNLSSLQ